MKKIKLSEVKMRIKKLHGKQICIISNTYKGVAKKAFFIDKDFGAWETHVYCVLKGNGHPANGPIKQKKSISLPINKIVERLQKVHKNILSLDETTYINVSTKAKFIDMRYGEWWAVPSSVFKGHGHPHRGFLRQARSSNNYLMRFHWKTNEELVCQGSWEAKVVDYFNKNQIEFEWQPRTFIMPNGKTYRPDLFLINENKWIEIKGWMRKDAQEKWDWFLTINPTAELWKESKLKEMGVL